MPSAAAAPGDEPAHPHDRDRGLDEIPATPELDPGSAGWLQALAGDGPRRQSALRGVHAMLLRGARREVARRAPQLQITRPELEDLAYQAAADALLRYLGRRAERAVARRRRDERRPHREGHEPARPAICHGRSTRAGSSSRTSPPTWPPGSASSAFAGRAGGVGGHEPGRDAEQPGEHGHRGRVLDAVTGPGRGQKRQQAGRAGRGRRGQAVPERGRGEPVGQRVHLAELGGLTGCLGLRQLLQRRGPVGRGSCRSGARPGIPVSGARLPAAPGWGRWRS
jgi:hypothetical protein